MGVLMESTLKIFSLLENTKFSADNDLYLLKIAVDLIYDKGLAVWQKGSKPRAAFLELLSGKLVIDKNSLADRKDLAPLIAFLQGVMILTASLLNGIGRPPLSLRSKDDLIKITILNKNNNIVIKSGVLDEGFLNLLREFKYLLYGQAGKSSFSQKEITVIKETFRQTNIRLNNENSFIKKMEKDPAIIFKEENSGNFTPRFFLLISALPLPELNNLLINVGSYLPAELEEFNEDMFKVRVRGYLTTSTQEMHELFKKVRLLLKLYFGKQKQIIMIIIREKTKELFGDILSNTEIKKAVVQNLKNARENQFELRMNLLNNLIKVM